MKADDKQEIEKEIINEEENVQKTKVTYWVHPHHRDKRPDKSQWTIIPDEEFSCFVKAIHLDDSFGLDLKDNLPHVLGKRKLKAIQERVYEDFCNREGIAQAKNDNMSDNPDDYTPEDMEELTNKLNSSDEDSDE